MKIVFYLLVVLGCCFPPRMARGQTIDLTGSWEFALDPLGQGEAMWTQAWPIDTTTVEQFGYDWDRVTVPHCWSIDPRFDYVGKAWYRKALRLPDYRADSHVRLAFEAVFYRCRVWVNGQLVGQHEGGYTPFAFEVGQYLVPSGLNYLAIEVDNSWDATTIPGASLVDGHPRRQLYPWWDYGGITRPLSLEIRPATHVVKQKIEALPDLESGAAKVRVVTWISNTGKEATQVILTAELESDEGATQSLFVEEEPIRVPAGRTITVTRAVELAASAVTLWHFDHPYLYRLRTRLAAGGREHQEYFGIRRVEVRGSEILLNGEVIRLGGASRHADHPDYGSMDPDTVANQDMRLMKEANLQLSRIAHYALNKSFLDWADRHGHLIIAEAGNWAMSTTQMEDPAMRANWKNQHREMVERDWNRPSIFAWSVGNEYDSWTDEGDSWTRDMIAYTRTLDTTRLFTFAAIGYAISGENLARERNSMRYLDFISFNNYGAISDMDQLHEQYPKPIVVTEFGRRANEFSPAERRTYLLDVLAAVRERPFIAGIAWWSFSDYKSRYPGTSRSGYREWGLVDEGRQLRPLYHTIQKELAPATLTATAPLDGGDTEITVTARPDFPRQTLRGFRLTYTGLDGTENSAPLPALAPGASHTARLPTKPNTPVTLVRPEGYPVVTTRENQAE